MPEKKRKLTRKVLVDYFGKEHCGLTDKVVESTLLALSKAQKTWLILLENCFLSSEFKEKYTVLLENRLKILDL